MSGTVIVAGGLGTLGQAIVAELGRHEWKVAAIGHGEAAEVEGASLVLGGVELTEESSVAAAFARVARELGPVTALVNAAGGFVWEPVDGGSSASWDRMYRINLLTAAVSCRVALAVLSKQGGAIVNVGAAGAERPGRGMAPYAASKAGVKALTLSLAEELRGRGMRVNALLPTILDTPANRADMPDADRKGWVRPEAAAKVVAFLVSDDAASVTGACIPVSLRG